MHSHAASSTAHERAVPAVIVKELKDMPVVRHIMLESLLQHPIATLQHAEIVLNQWTQQAFHSAEPAWTVFSAQLSTAQLMDVYVPLMGVFHHQLMVRLVCSLGVINALNSLLKWCVPAYRPYWWIHESAYAHNASSLQQQQWTCETTAAFPSSHSSSFTAFVYLLAVFGLTHCCRQFRLSQRYLKLSCCLVALAASLGMWLSRMYFGCQFLHQCVLSSLAAFVLLHIFDRYSTFLYTLERSISMLVVLCFGLLPVAVYFAMLRMQVDPHWSVRMAFKWCADPSFLRHEASPIFVLGRDFGYLMGVALSAPLYKRYDSKPSLIKRIPILLMLELLNHYARMETPKHRGRFIFVAYECTRNLMHSYSLLSVLYKIT